MSLEAAVQKRGERLVVIGLTPFGVKVFTIEQTGARWTMTEHLKRKGGLPIDPAFLLADIHRVFLSGSPDDVMVEERSGGRVTARRFRPKTGCPEGEVVVTYEGGLGADGAPPRRTVLRNGYHRYELEIETVSHKWLD